MTTALIAWIALSVIAAPILGTAIRNADRAATAARALCPCGSC